MGNWLPKRRRDIEQLATAVDLPAVDVNTVAPVDFAESPQLDHDLLADLAIEIWRMERRMGRIAESVDPQSLAPIRDSLRRLDSVMEQYGLELRVHDGEMYVDGVGFEVLHIREEAESLVVVETIQPTIVLGDRVIRHGKVVAGAASEGNH
jgi:hypothetical protein